MPGVRTHFSVSLPVLQLLETRHLKPARGYHPARRRFQFYWLPFSTDCGFLSPGDPALSSRRHDPPSVSRNARIRCRPPHGTGAETSFEFTLSLPLESTAVAT